MSCVPLRRGDVWIAQVSFPDKPEAPMVKFCVILQEGRLFDNAPTVLVAHLTTKHLDRLYPTDVYLPSEECQNGGGAKIILNQFHTIPKSSLIAYKYSLSRDTMRKVDLAILVGTGIVKIEELESLLKGG